MTDSLQTISLKAELAVIAQQKQNAIDLTTKTLASTTAKFDVQLANKQAAIDAQIAADTTIDVVSQTAELKTAETTQGNTVP